MDGICLDADILANIFLNTCQNYLAVMLTQSIQVCSSAQPVPQHWLDRTGKTSTPDVTPRQFPSRDQPTVSMLPIPTENTRPPQRDRLSYRGKGKTETISSSRMKKKRERVWARDLFSHSDSNFAQRSNVHSHPSHCFTGWKSPFCTKRPNLILSFCRRRRVPWPVLIREVLLSEKPEGAEQSVRSRGLSFVD